MELCFSTTITLPEKYSMQTSNYNVCTAIIQYKGSSSSGQICGRHIKSGHRCGYHKNK